MNIPNLEGEIRAYDIAENYHKLSNGYCGFPKNNIHHPSLLSTNIPIYIKTYTFYMS